MTTAKLSSFLWILLAIILLSSFFVRCSESQDSSPLFEEPSNSDIQITNSDDSDFWKGFSEPYIQATIPAGSIAWVRNKDQNDAAFTAHCIDDKSILGGISKDALPFESLILTEEEINGYRRWKLLNEVTIKIPLSKTPDYLTSCQRIRRWLGDFPISPTIQAQLQKVDSNSWFKVKS